MTTATPADIPPADTRPTPGTRRVEPPMQPTWLLVLPWMSIIAAGALSIAAPSAHTDLGWQLVRIRDGLWLVAGALLIVSGVRGVRTSGAPRASWVFPLCGLAVLAGSGVMAHVLGDRLDALEATADPLRSAQARAALGEMVADDQRPLTDRAARSRLLAELTYDETGEAVDVLTDDGTWRPFAPDEELRAARDGRLALQALRPRLDRVPWLVTALAVVSLLVGAVLPARACMRLRDAEG